MHTALNEANKPIEPIKASEFLRQAVDNHLAANMEDFLESKNRGICGCLSMEAGTDNKKSQTAARIRTEVYKYIPAGSYLFDDGNEYPVEERQAIRFMFSEFLALYFEDMGD